MHRHTVSSSAAAGRESLLVQKRGDHQYAVVSRSPAGPSRLKAEGEATAHGGAIRTRTSCDLGQGAEAVDRSLISDDQITCQSKLYDAFDLQEIEQQLDRKLVLNADPNKTRSCSSSIDDRPSPRSMKSLYTAYSLLDIDHRSSPKDVEADQPQGAPMKYSSRKRGAVDADNGGADRHDRNQSSYDDDQRLVKAARSFSMPRAGSQDQHMGVVDHQKSKNAQAAQEKRMIRKSQSSDGGHNGLSTRWSLINSFFRSKKNKQNRPAGVVQEALSPIIFSHEQHADVLHHHYHHQYVHRHYHHHQYSVHAGVHFEEIDWPLSPARLQELGWPLAHDNKLQ